MAESTERVRRHRAAEALNIANLREALKTTRENITAATHTYIKIARIAAATGQQAEACIADEKIIALQAQTRLTDELIAICNKIGTTAELISSSKKCLENANELFGVVNKHEELCKQYGIK